MRDPLTDGFEASSVLSRQPSVEATSLHSSTFLRQADDPLAETRPSGLTQPKVKP